MKNKISLLLAVVLVFSLLTTACSKKPVDDGDVTVSQEGPYNVDNIKEFSFKDYKNYILDSGIAKGIYDKKTSLDKGVTRAEFIELLARHYASGNVTEITTIGDFYDVPADSEHYGAISWALKNGNVAGGTVAKFYPDEVVTREDAAAFLYNYAYESGQFSGVQPNAVETDLKDEATISDYAVDAVNGLRAYGIIVDDESGCFNPKNELTMEEMINWIGRFCAIVDRGLEVYYDYSEGGFTVKTELE